MVKGLKNAYLMLFSSLAGRLDVDSPLHDDGDRLLRQLVRHVFPLELHVDDVQQALLGGLIFQDDEGKDLRDVVDVKVVEAAAVLVLHPRAHQDEFQIPLSAEAC